MRWDCVNNIQQRPALGRKNSTLRFSSAAIYHQHVMFSAFQELFCIQVFSYVQYLSESETFFIFRCSLSPHQCCLIKGVTYRKSSDKKMCFTWGEETKVLTLSHIYIADFFSKAQWLSVKYHCLSRSGSLTAMPKLRSFYWHLRR